MKKAKTQPKSNSEMIWNFMKHCEKTKWGQFGAHGINVTWEQEIKTQSKRLHGDQKKCRATAFSTNSSVAAYAIHLGSSNLTCSLRFWPSSVRAMPGHTDQSNVWPGLIPWLLQASQPRCSVLGWCLWCRFHPPGTRECRQRSSLSWWHPGCWQYLVDLPACHWCQ